MTGLAMVSVLAIGCSSLGSRSKDYMFAVQGTVVGDENQPLSGATVTLQVQTPVYAAVTPIKTKRATTDDKGRFLFTYLAHDPKVEYALVIEKEGYRSETVRGSAPPPGNHEVQLKR
jgi:hypothetical protein